MPTFNGKYEPPEPIIRHRRLWLELVRASLSVAELPRYARKLISLYARFLAVRTVPTADEASMAISELLDQLRDAAHAEGGRYPDDGPYLRAARHLQRADRLGRDELERDADP